MKNGKNQSKVKKLFENVYQIQPNRTQKSAPVSSSKRSSVVIKAADLRRSLVKAEPVISDRDAVLSSDSTLASLKQSLNAMKDLEDRMKFMLSEIEEFISE